MSAHIRARHSAAIAFAVVCLSLAACGGSGSRPMSLLSGLAAHGNASVTAIRLYEAAVTRTQHAAKAAPNSAPAWDAYAKAVFQLADTNYFFATSTSAGGFTSYGAKELAALAPVWKHYLVLAPARADTVLAADVAFAFGSPGVHDYALAETGQEIVAAHYATSSDQWAQLAVYAYLAHEKDRAELAEARAISLAPVAARAALKAEITQAGAGQG
ncbi:MAG: hypothetical protein ABSG64_08460 [Solirubrobacteraceae bacterium]